MKVRLTPTLGEGVPREIQSTDDDQWVLIHDNGETSPWFDNRQLRNQLLDLVNPLSDDLPFVEQLVLMIEDGLVINVDNVKDFQ